MKRHILYLFILFIASLSVQAAGRRQHITVNIQRPMDSEPTPFAVNQSLFKQLYNYGTVNALMQALENKELVLSATTITSNNSERFSSNYSINGGIGHWFSNKGGTSSYGLSNRAICVEFKDGNFLISLNTAKNIEEGGNYTVKESFISSTKTDTLTYVFNISVSGTETTITDDQPTFAFHRASVGDDWMLTPLVRSGENEWLHQNYIQVRSGEDITFSAELGENVTKVSCAWFDGDNQQIRSYLKDPTFTIPADQVVSGSMYVMRARITYSDNGASRMKTQDYPFYIDVQDNPGEFFKWEDHTTQFGYDFRSEYPQLDEPQKVHTFYKRGPNNTQLPANKYVGKWWSAFWGDNLNSEVGTTEAEIMDAAKNMVDYYDQEFGFLRDEMGWPPDLSARSGYKSIIYIFGSGLTNDNTPNTEQGGYQSATYADGQTWACVYASYYPFSRFRSDADRKWNDGAYQRDAMIHEGIHATFADMPGVKGSSWFHEAGNTWAQSRMANLRGNGQEDDNARAGYLDCGPFLAPFMPIECYSGWLQDGSFGGPQAQGVNMYEGSQQICTWRYILGGTQYANSFPTILSYCCGYNSVPWIWRYCDNRVLEGIGNYVGDSQMRDIILQYRARMSIYDFGLGYKAYRNTASDNFGVSVQEEWSPYWIDVEPWRMTPYAQPQVNDADGWMAPDPLTNPGWSGANFIPIHIDKSKKTATVEFLPEDKHLKAQLCYRTKDGTSYYSQPAYCGKLTIDTSKNPANGVIIMVVANTDYIYDDANGEEQRKHHFDYRIRLGEGALAVADPYQKWFFHERTITDQEFETGIESIEEDMEMEENHVQVSRMSEGIYNLQGQRLNAPQKGINIINGKKVIIK